MRQMVRKAALGIGLAAATLVASVPADAQRWGGHRGGWSGYRGGWGGYRGGWGGYRRGDRTGAALLGGIVGLGVGAAIASSARPRYYDRGYGYGYGGPVPPAYYDGGYYDYAPACWTERRFDPYYGYSVPVRVCR